jgi:Chromosome segregation ATPases
MSLKNTSKLGASKVSTTKSVGGSQFGTQSKLSRPIQNSTEFAKHLKSLQQQAEENIEDEYIKNLQQQIAYMELELKLLKEKELEAKASVSQIDKFFNDGVPLNENILALKNQYNYIKKELENKIDDINEKRGTEVKLTNDLKTQYERNTARLKDLVAEIEAKTQEFDKQMAELRMAYLNEKHRRSELEDELRKLEVLFRAKTDENLKMTRELEREAILVDNKKEKMVNFRAKTLKDLEEKDKWITSLQDDLEAIRAKAAINPEVTFLEKEIKELNQKITRCEKESFTAQMRVKEMQELLKDRSKEREIEGDHKRTLIAKINQVKSRIDEENKVNELVIQQKVKEKEDKEMREIKKRIEEIKREQTIIKHRHKEKEEHVDQMSQDKIGMQQEILEAEQTAIRLEKEIKDKKERLIDLMNKLAAHTEEERELKEKLAPILKENEKLSVVIPAIQKENEETIEKIAHLEKLNELSLQLKNVNLEELKLLTQSNDQIYNTISELTKKWEYLQKSTSKLTK